MYGNHQNSARMKKNDPNEATLDDALDTDHTDDSSSEADEINNLIDEVKADAVTAPEPEPMGENETENVQTPTSEENDLAHLQGHKEEDVLESLKGEDVQESAEEGQENNEEDQAEEEVEEEEKLIETDGNEVVTEDKTEDVDEQEDDLISDKDTEVEKLMREQAAIDKTFDQLPVPGKTTWSPLLTMHVQAILFPTVQLRIASNN